MGESHVRRKIQHALRPPEQPGARGRHNPPATFTVDHPAVAGARIVAANGASDQYSIDIPVYPAAPPFTDYRISDGLTLAPYTRPLGEGNRDGHAAPGESFAVLLPDAERCVAQNSSPTIPASITPCASAKAARQSLCPRFVPAVCRDTGFSC